MRDMSLEQVRKPFKVKKAVKQMLIQVPVILTDQSDIPDEYRNVSRELLKHGTGKYSNIILTPQPSDSPNDPLNVSLLQQRSLGIRNSQECSGRHGAKMSFLLS